MILDTRILGFDSDSFNTHYNSYAISFPPGLQARACEAEACGLASLPKPGPGLRPKARVVMLAFWQSNARCATNKYFQIIGSIHDIESYFGMHH